MSSSSPSRSKRPLPLSFVGRHTQTQPQRWARPPLPPSALWPSASKAKVRLRPMSFIAAFALVGVSLQLASLRLASTTDSIPAAPTSKHSILSSLHSGFDTPGGAFSRRMAVVQDSGEGYLSGNEVRGDEGPFDTPTASSDADPLVNQSREEQARIDRLEINRLVQKRLARKRARSQVERKLDTKAFKKLAPKKKKKGGRVPKPTHLVPPHKANDYKFTLWFDPDGNYALQDSSQRIGTSLAISNGDRLVYKIRHVRYESCRKRDRTKDGKDFAAVWNLQRTSKDVVYSSENGFNMEKFRSQGDDGDDRYLLPCPEYSFPELVDEKEFQLLQPPEAKFRLFEEHENLKAMVGGDDELWNTHTRNQVVAFSYWSPSAQREVAISLRQGSLRSSLCKKGENCPRDCQKWAEQQLQNITSIKEEKSEALEMALWDARDGQCKYDDLPELIAPRRPFGGACMCFTTCLTPQSQDVRTTWPWTNQSQHQYFYPQIEYSADGIPDYTAIKVARLENHRIRRAAHNDRPIKPAYVCPSKVGSEAAAVASKGTIKLDYDLHNDFEHHLFFFPEAKLIFCGIPKVGITEWLKFLRFTLGAGDYLSFPHHKQDRTQFSLSKLPLDKAEEILNDPSWTKAVFFRDPAERLLSAWLDKFVKEEYARRHYQLGPFVVDEDMGNGTILSRTTTTMPFEMFVDMLASELPPIERRAKMDPKDTSFVPDLHGLSWTTDPHWRPQSMTCGLDVLLPSFDFIGSLNHVAEHTRMLLERTNLWESHGQKYTAGPPDVQVAQCGIQPVPKDYPQEGFNQPRHGSPAKHATGSKSKMERYYTPELLRKVREIYKWDYQIWDDLSSRPSSDVPSGRDLAHVREYCEPAQSASTAQS